MKLPSGKKLWTGWKDGGFGCLNCHRGNHDKCDQDGRTDICSCWQLFHDPETYLPSFIGMPPEMLPHLPYIYRMAAKEA